ncbi:hypothetical protein CA235_17625 [Sphingomonas sp. ABOLF]|uniref:hypothetical protein n=1 Tax=Sphingomonas sp. ABOLF TaxID=1985879 RepID=UPI000F7DD0BD|nr:hypothetical protein [Sphingomonas sp. ABOLF]RSV12293.1 hypothetical protein CA235_17625 [Sphingomonas sp. ABOLF]
MIVTPHNEVLPATDAAGVPTRSILDIGNYTAPAAAVLRTAIAAGVRFPREALMRTMSDYDNLPASLRAALLAWVRAPLAKADGTGLVETAYGLTGAANLTPAVEKPLLKKRASGLWVFDFWNDGSAAQDQANLVRANTVPATPGLSVAISGAAIGAAGDSGEGEVAFQQLSSPSNGVTNLGVRRTSAGMIQAFGKRAKDDTTITLTTTVAWPTLADSIVIASMNLASSGTDALTMSLYLAGPSGPAERIGSIAGLVTGTVNVVGTMSIGNGPTAPAGSRFKGEIAEVVLAGIALDRTHDLERNALVAMMQRNLAA